MATLNYSAARAESSPGDTPVLVIGQVQNLQAVGFAPVKCKLEPLVTEKVLNTIAVTQSIVSSTSSNTCSVSPYV